MISSFKNLISGLNLIQDLSMVFTGIRMGFPKPAIEVFARDLFGYVPADFKEPQGRVNEQEFVDAIQVVFRLFTKTHS